MIASRILFCTNTVLINIYVYEFLKRYCKKPVAVYRSDRYHMYKPTLIGLPDIQFHAILIDGELCWIRI